MWVLRLVLLLNYLRPAAAVIPALIAYINVVDVKKLVVEGPAFGSVWEAVGLGKTILSVE